jgi:aspartokinase
MDNLLVVKFGGTSVGAADRIQQLPSIVAQLKKTISHSSSGLLSYFKSN